MGIPNQPRPPDEHDSSFAGSTDEKMYTSEPLENDDGEMYVIRQQNVGPGYEFGGGEWPSPETSPTDEPRSPE